MDFSLTSLFVVPTGNTLPSLGTASSALTSGQVGIFKSDVLTAVTASSVTSLTSREGIQVMQGTKEYRNPTNKRSDVINSNKVVEWYKIQGQGTASPEVWEVADFTAKCNEDITFTVRGLSNYMNTISANGLTRSVTIKTPCCDCGGSPCDTVDGYLVIYEILRKIIQEANVALGKSLAYETTGDVDDSIAVLNDLEAADWGTSLGMATFYNFTTDDTDTNATKIIITTKTLTQYGKFCNIALNTFEWDRIWFRVWIYKSPETTQDFIVFDRCEQVATTTQTQRSTFAHGLSSEVLQMEYDYYSYQAADKALFQLSQYNQGFTSQVSDGVIYDLYYIKATPIYNDGLFNPAIQQSFTTIVAAPQTSTSTATALVNGAISATTALVVDTVVGTIAVGQKITGTGVPYGTYVAAVSGSNVTLSQAATLADNTALTFTNSISSQVSSVLIAYLGKPSDKQADNTYNIAPLLP